MFQLNAPTVSPLARHVKHIALLLLLKTATLDCLAQNIPTAPSQHPMSVTEAARPTSTSLDMLGDYTTDQLIAQQQRFLHDYMYSPHFVKAVQRQLFLRDTMTAMHQQSDAPTMLLDALMKPEITPTAYASEISAIQTRRDSLLVHTVPQKVAFPDSWLGGIAISIEDSTVGYTDDMTHPNDPFEIYLRTRGQQHQLHDGDVFINAPHDTLIAQETPLHELWHSLTRRMLHDSVRSTYRDSTNDPYFDDQFAFPHGMAIPPDATVDEMKQIAYLFQNEEATANIITIKYYLAVIGGREMHTSISAHDIIALRTYSLQLPANSPTRCALNKNLRRLGKLVGVNLDDDTHVERLLNPRQQSMLDFLLNGFI